MNGYRWAPSDLGPALTRELPVQVVMARSPHRCPLSYGGSSADVIQLPDMAGWRFSKSKGMKISPYPLSVSEGVNYEKIFTDSTFF